MKELFGERRKYQELIDALCRKYCIPSIPVNVVPKGSLNTLWGYFDNIDFKIEVEPGIPKKYLIHEWTHYCIQLISNVSELEESLCDLVPKGILQEVDEEETTELTTALEAIKEEDNPLNDKTNDCVTCEEV